MKLLRSAAIVAALLSAAPAVAQNEFKTPTAGKTVVGVQVMCQNGSSQAVPCSPLNPLPISGSISASLGGFAPNGNYNTLTATASSSASTNLPAGTDVGIQNTSTVDVSCVLDPTSATATTNKIIVRGGATVFVTVGSNTKIACINQTGSASNVIALMGGTGLGTNFGGGGGGGGGGGAVTLASGAVSSGAYSSGAFASGSFASGAVGAGAYAAGSLVAGAVVDLTNLSTPIAPNTATATKGILLGGQYDSTQKTLTNGQQAGVSLSPRGALFVAVGADGFNVTNAGTFAVQAAQATAGNLNATVVGTGTFAVQLTGATNNINNIAGTVSLPTGASTAANQPSNSAIGATTSGQTGNLMMGAVTTAAPSYTTAQTNPFSLTTAGDLRTVFSNTSIAVTQATSSNLKAQVDPLTAASWGIGATAAAVPGSAHYNAVNISGNLVGLTGLATGATVKAMTVAIVDSSGNQITSFGGSGGTAIGDNSAFTQSTTSETPIGCLYNTAYANATSGRSTIARCGQAGQLYVNIDQVAGTALGTPASYGSTPTGAALSVNAYVTNTLTAGSTNADTIAASTSNVSPVQSYGLVYNGATFDRARSGGATGSTMVAGAGAAGSAIAGNPLLMGGSDGTNARAVLTGTDGRLSTNIAQIGGTTVDVNSGNKSNGTIRTVVATDQVAIATAGQGATAATAPSGATQEGLRAQNAEQTAVTNGQMVGAAADLVGKQIVLPYANPENSLDGTITTAMTGTTDTAVSGMGAQGSGVRVYVTGCVISNSHATVGTDVVLKDGSGGTVLWTFPAAPAYGGTAFPFPTPIKTTANTGLFAANITTGSSTKVSCTGYKGI